MRRWTRAVPTPTPERSDWRSEDRKLYYAHAVGFSSPVVLSGILQRGSESDPEIKNVIYWREQGHVPFAVHDSVLQGNIPIGATVPSHSLFSNVKFLRGKVMTEGYAARYAEFCVDEGRLTMQAPAPSLLLRDTTGRERLKAKDGGLALTGMLKTARGADVAGAATLTLGAGGNLFRITGTESIRRIEPLAAGTVVALTFERALTVQDGENLKVAGAFEATPDATLVLISDGANWLELSRSRN